VKREAAVQAAEVDVATQLKCLTDRINTLCRKSPSVNDRCVHERQCLHGIYGVFFGRIGRTGGFEKNQTCQGLEVSVTVVQKHGKNDRKIE